MRRTLRDHERAAGERFMGSEVAAKLSGSMAGPLEATHRAEPLSWRPAMLEEAAESVAEEGGGAVGAGGAEAVAEEVRRFAAAAQCTVAGLPLEQEEAECAGRRLRVAGEVHTDFGSYMAAKVGRGRGTALGFGLGFRLGSRASRP